MGANLQLAKEILSKIGEQAGASVGTIGFAYGRDPVPHSPPRIFGYFTTQKQLFHTLNKYGMAQTGILTGHPDDVPYMQYVDFDMGEYLYYDKVYVSTPTDFKGDKLFATSVGSYAIADHAGYFRFAAKSLCGFDNSDSFLSSRPWQSCFLCSKCSR